MTALGEVVLCCVYCLLCCVALFVFLSFSLVELSCTCSSVWDSKYIFQLLSSFKPMHIHFNHQISAVVGEADDTNILCILSYNVYSVVLNSCGFNNHLDSLSTRYGGER